MSVKLKRMNVYILFCIIYLIFAGEKTAYEEIGIYFRWLGCIDATC